MKSLGFYLSVTLLACSVSAANTGRETSLPEYSMLLVGGGLQACRSTNTRYCSAADTFSAASKSADLFALSPENIANVADTEFWGAERVIEQQRTLALLEFVRSRLDSELISAQELARLWRSAETEMDGIWVSGRVNYNELTERELNFVFDQLQVTVLAAPDKNDRRSSTRMKEFASLAKTKDEFTTEIYRKIVELAQQVAGSQRKPRLLVVTASSRDPFADVDFYTNLFVKAGAEVSWLPLNAAYQRAQQLKDSNKPSCDALTEYLATEHGTYQRGRVYPDLMQQLQRFCQSGTTAAVEQIRKADAIFFNGDDQSLTLKAFRLEDGSASEELKQIERMLSAGQIIVAGTGAGAAAMAGGSFQGKRIPMISSGDSYSAMQFGAFDLPAPRSGCDKDQSCSNGLAEKHLTFTANGGLGLFNWGTVDTHLSERGRQGRLIRLLNDTQTRFGFGIDEATAMLVGFSNTDSEPEVKMSVLGAAGVYVVDTQGMQNAGEGSATVIKQVNTHYLTRGDALEIKDGVLRTRFAAWKFAPNNMQAPMLTSGELFERDNYKQLAHLLCLTQSRQADGKAVKVGQGQQISLYKDHSSYARQGVYQLQDKEVQYCSYRNFRVDVQPVQ
jgi:cyanophycinase